MPVSGRSGVQRHWLVLPVDPEGEPFIAWGSVEADEYRRQPLVYRVEEYVRVEDEELRHG